MQQDAYNHTVQQGFCCILSSSNVPVDSRLLLEEDAGYLANPTACPFESRVAGQMTANL